MKNQYYLFMDDADRKLFDDFCASIELTVTDEALYLPEAVETEDGPWPCVHVFFSRMYDNLLTIGRIALPKGSSRDKSDEMKRLKAAYRKLVKWVHANFDDGLAEVFRSGEEILTERHWIGPNTRRSMEAGDIELCFGTNGNRFVLADRE